MSIVYKKRGQRQYAYLSALEGSVVRQRYIGDVDDPVVSQLGQISDDQKAIPERLAPLFWDTALKNIQIRKHARSIITRILELGDMQAVEWMQMTYPGAKIVEVLLTSRNISDKSRNFWRLWYKVDEYAG